jgi:S-formylglutathione hydrolase FrmB
MSKSGIMRRFIQLNCLGALFFSFASLTAAHAQARIDCNAFNSQILHEVVHYCVYLPSGYDSGAKSLAVRYPVLYFLHGLGDNEQTLFKSGAWTLLDDLRRQHKIGDFLIVAPEGRRSFYINSADGSVRYSDFFLREFIPHIEANYRVRAGREGRAISGVSMGGYGALRFAFAFPEMFSAVSAQSAALMTTRDLDSAARSGSPSTNVLVAVFGSPIDGSHWNENNPLTLSKRNPANLRRLAIYFNCGRDDNFGFEEGASALDRTLKKEGVKHEYHLYPGDHSSAYFLAHFAEVMEFHSHAFGLSP